MNWNKNLLLGQDAKFFIKIKQTARLAMCVENAVTNLTEEKRQSFLSLTDSKSLQPKTVKGIYLTNCFTLGTNKTSPSGMLPNLARLNLTKWLSRTYFYLFFRLNDSCCPITEFFWNTEENVEELRATRLILSGTELTDCYIDFPVQGRLTRRYGIFPTNIVLFRG
jgi:hypothetical protein